MLPQSCWNDSEWSVCCPRVAAFLQRQCSNRNYYWVLLDFVFLCDLGFLLNFICFAPLSQKVHKSSKFWYNHRCLQVQMLGRQVGITGFGLEADLGLGPADLVYFHHCSLAYRVYTWSPNERNERRTIARLVKRLRAYLDAYRGWIWASWCPYGRGYGLQLVESDDYYNAFTIFRRMQGMINSAVNVSEFRNLHISNRGLW